MTSWPLARNSAAAAATAMVGEGLTRWQRWETARLTVISLLYSMIGRAADIKGFTGRNQQAA
jgi:hypothetical protein